LYDIAKIARKSKEGTTTGDTAGARIKTDRTTNIALGCPNDGEAKALILHLRRGGVGHPQV